MRDLSRQRALATIFDLACPASPIHYQFDPGLAPFLGIIKNPGTQYYATVMRERFRNDVAAHRHAGT